MHRDIRTEELKIFRAAIFRGPGDVQLGHRPDPVIQEPTDAVVRVVRSCVCASDLWYYRGVNDHPVGSIGHRPACLHGIQSNCLHGSPFGNGTVDGGQGEYVRTPYAATTLVKVPGATRGLPPSALNVAAVRFSPGARSAWHSHDGGHTLYVTEGRGRVQLRGQDMAELNPGDVVYAPDGEEHWHGAAPDRFMTHLSITEGAPHWGPHVTDAEYGGIAG
jgi:quercetin dioxygenase-like cupin family protein